MSEDERKLVDTRGRFVTVVEDGRTVNDVEWCDGGLLLSTRRLVLVTNEGKRTIPLSKISALKVREDVNEAIASVSAYVSCQVGADVTLVSPAAFEEFLDALFGALLDQRSVLVKHPALKGGVVQDADWVEGRMNVDGGSVNLALSTGTFVEIQAGDVGTAEETRKTVSGTERSVVELEHTEDGTSVETHVSGAHQAVTAIGTFTRRGESPNAEDVQLSDAEREVLMAVYTGVSAFEIPDFVGMDVQAVEAVFESLVEKGILEEVRTRREVELQARGRSIAGEAMTDQ
jgi:helix-turn-helix protein